MESCCFFIFIKAQWWRFQAGKGPNFWPWPHDSTKAVGLAIYLWRHEQTKFGSVGTQGLSSIFMLYKTAKIHHILEFLRPMIHVLIFNNPNKNFPDFVSKIPLFLSKSCPERTNSREIVWWYSTIESRSLFVRI